VGVLHYAWILDDAFVYFRYVDHWVLLDAGLVYNRGEYVEGFTSPFWILVLGALRAAGLGYWLAVRAVGLAAFAGFWVLAVALNRRLAPAAAPVVNLPLLYLAFLYGPLCYFTSGTESPLVLLLAGACGLFVLTPSSRPLQLALALAPLVRPELGLVYAAGLLWYALRERRPPWVLLGLGALCGGGWLSFRILYYADLAPNTFYLKDATAWGQGLAYLWDTLAPYHVPGLAALAAVALGWLGRRGVPLHLAERGAMWGMAALVALYVLKVGGDARHFRYLAFSFTLGVLALGGVVEGVLAELAARARRALPLALGLGVALFAASLHSRQTGSHPAFAGSEPQMFDGIDDAEHYRQHWGLPALEPWSLSDPLERRERYLAARAAGSYTGVRTGYVCWKLYAEPERRVIHSLGLTEPYLARMVMGSDRPGHKWNLIGLARDLERIQRWWGRPPAPGMFRAAVEAGVAPAWFAPNLERLERVERKVHNRHRPAENLGLALRPGPRIEPPYLPRAAPLSLPDPAPPAGPP